MPERPPAMPAVPPGASAALAQCAAAIEQAFLAAGQGLGAGLVTVEDLSQALAGILGEFQGGRLAEASAALDRLSRRLLAVSAALPRDVANLQTLATGNAEIGKHLDGLLEHIRMMTIIASSARIEAACFDEAAGLAGFTQEMSALTDAVRRGVAECATTHAALGDRMRRLVAAQSALDHDFRETLLALSRELSDIFALVTDRQCRARDLAEALAGDSARLAGSVGAALVALQGGDAARQRLEHVTLALHLAAPSQVLPVLYRLGAAQLDDLTATFGAEAAAIDAMLDQVSRETRALATAGRTLLGSAEGSGSFLARFHARLDEAAALIATCGRARAEVAHAMEVLRSDVDGLRSVVSDLGTTTVDLVMVGINAGLRAARLGTDGRSLMVIADELKRLAGVVTEAATGLMTSYEALAEASRTLDLASEMVTAEDAGTTVMGILTDFEGIDRRMAAFVATLQARTQGFEAEIQETRGTFQDTTEAVAALRTLAGTLEAQGGGSDEVPHEAAALLAAKLWPHYTMAREREIHRAVVGCGPEDAGARASGEVMTDDLNDLLFDAA